jgi:hypothetical protein
LSATTRPSKGNLTRICALFTGAKFGSTKGWQQVTAWLEWVYKKSNQAPKTQKPEISAKSARMQTPKKTKNITF